MDASKRLTIRVSGDVQIEAISVGLFDTIYDFLSIENLFDGGNSYFVIHNEQILSPSFTFSFLNIKDNDDLVVFKKRPKLKLTEHKKFVKPTNDMISQMYRQKYSRKTEKCRFISPNFNFYQPSQSFSNIQLPLHSGSNSTSNIHCERARLSDLYKIKSEISARRNKQLLERYKCQGIEAKAIRKFPTIIPSRLEAPSTQIISNSFALPNPMNVIFRGNGIHSP